MRSDPLAGYPAEVLRLKDNSGNPIFRKKPRAKAPKTSNAFGVSSAYMRRENTSHTTVLKPMKFRQNDPDTPNNNGEAVEAYLENVVHSLGPRPGLLAAKLQKKVVENCWMVAHGLDPNSACQRQSQGSTKT